MVPTCARGVEPLAFRIKFKGSVVQFVGRILRPAPGKTSVVVH